MDDLGSWKEIDGGDWIEDDEEAAEPRERALELETICIEHFTRLQLPVREMLLAPILPQRGLGMLFAGRGIGKTHVALGIAYAVSCGGEFLRWRSEKARNVLYVDGEMPQQAIQDRLKALMNSSELRPEPNTFRLLCMDRQELGTSLNLANRKHQELIDGHLDDVDLVILDNMSTLMNGGPENDAESWISMQDWLLQLRRRGVTVLVVHHASRNGNARGTSKREDVLDTVIQLKHPDGYDPSEGARFEVHLTKARGVFGDDAAPFEARLEMDDEGRADWICSDLNGDDQEEETGMLQRVLSLSRENKSIRVIASALDINRMKVQRLLKKAERLEKAGKLAVSSAES